MAAVALKASLLNRYARTVGLASVYSFGTSLSFGTSFKGELSSSPALLNVCGLRHYCSIEGELLSGAFENRCFLSLFHRHRRR
jgi:hypothetical protein